VDILGDFASDIILPIVSERQIYQGDRKKKVVKIRLNLDCTINGPTILINHQD